MSYRWGEDPVEDDRRYEAEEAARWEAEEAQRLDAADAFADEDEDPED